MNNYCQHPDVELSLFFSIYGKVFGLYWNRIVLYALHYNLNLSFLFHLSISQVTSTSLICNSNIAFSTSGEK